MTAPVQEAPPQAAASASKASLLDPAQLLRSLPDAIAKLDPRVLVKNPAFRRAARRPG